MNDLQTIPSTTANKNIPIEVLIDYSSKGLSYSEIGKLAGCDKTNVYHRFKTIGYDPEHVRAYKTRKSDVFTFWENKLLNSINDDDLKRANLQTKMMAFGIIYDKNRIEQGLAGQIIGFDNLPDAGLSQAISGLLSKAERVGIRLTDIVGELPSQLRDQASKLLPQSLPGADNPVTINAKP